MNAITKGVAALAICLAPAMAWAADGAGPVIFAYTQSPNQTTPQSASGGAASINFAGTLTTGQPCYALTASDARQGNRITVTVTATRTGQICAQVVTHNNYQGQVPGVLPGSYEFTVVHVVNGRSTTAYSATVQVQ